MNALKLLKKKEFDEAVEIFTELELQHPYSKWASRGQLMAGFALYKLEAGPARQRSGYCFK